MREKRYNAPDAALSFPSSSALTMMIGMVASLHGIGILIFVDLPYLNPSGATGEEIIRLLSMGWKCQQPFS